MTDVVSGYFLEMTPEGTIKACVELYGVPSATVEQWSRLHGTTLVSVSVDVYLAAREAQRSSGGEEGQ